MAELKKSLGYGTIIALSITSIMGTGLFLGHSRVARISGNLAIFAWLFLSIISVYISMLFAELVGMFPNAGGIYEFAKRTYGRFTSFIIGWITWLVGNITACLMIVAAMEILKPILESFISTTFVSSSLLVELQSILNNKFFPIGLVIAIIILLNLITLSGTDDSAILVIIFASISVLVVLVVVAFSIPHMDLGNFSTMIDDTIVQENREKNPLFQNLPLEFLVPIIIFSSLFIILETYFGWEAATFLAEETVNPEKVIPKSLIITTIITSVIGFVTAFVFLAVIPWNELKESNEPFSAITQVVFSGNDAANILINLGIVFVMFGAAASGIISGPRLLLAMARDKLFINSLAQVHPKYQTPYKAVYFQTIIMILVVIIGFQSYERVLSMLVPLAIIMYISVILAVPLLRFKLPDMNRPFKAPFGKILPIFIILMFITIIILWIMNEEKAWDLFRLQLSFIFFGFPIYLTLLFYYDPDVIVRLNDLFAYFSLTFERVLLPMSLRVNILEHLGNIKGKRLLEFGCGVGTMTMNLARRVGEFGMIYATDMSYTSVRIAQNRITKRGISNVVFLHDIHQVNRVHHNIPDVDGIVSIGMLGYIQDITKVLKEMAKLVPEGGKVFFVDYVDLFKVIPNVSWLSNHSELVGLFRECGFSVRVEKIKGLFWNYVYIYGIRTEHEVPFV